MDLSLRTRHPINHSLFLCAWRSSIRVCWKRTWSVYLPVKANIPTVHDVSVPWTATAYASCMVSIVGIHCNENNIEMVGGTAEVTKVMASGPRRIERVGIELDFSMNNWSEDIKKRIING